jgi:hypothetical protein
VRRCLEMVGCLLKKLDAWSYWRRARILQAYQAQYDEIPQPSEMEPRAGIRPQEKDIGCKKSHGETQGRGPAPKSTAT